MNTLMSSFEVSDVPRAAEPLSEVPYHQAINQLLGEPVRYKKQQLTRVEASEAATTGSIEACSRYHGRLVADVLAHPVIVALHRAFTQHRPLCISPDMIWLLICQGVAHHVNVQSENLRSRFV